MYVFVCNSQYSYSRLNQVMAVDPSNSKASFHLALVYLDLQNIAQSERWFLHTLAIDPHYRSALYNLGLLYNHLQRYQEAVDLLSKFISLQPEHTHGAQVAT